MTSGEHRNFQAYNGTTSEQGKPRLVDFLHKTIAQQFSAQTTFIVAVSGGVDSMSLLHLLTHIPDYTYIIVSIDHSIRADSHEDITLVKTAADKAGFSFYSEKAAVPSLAKQKRQGIEETARDARYNILQKYKKQFHAAAIITAHHQDDQLETILFHLIRGSDLHGLIGMEAFNQQDIFRPLLTIPKAELLAYAKQHKLTWREDSTNVDTAFSRNHIRHHLLKEFPPELILQAKAQAHILISQLNLLVTTWKARELKNSIHGHTFSRKNFLTLPIYIQFYLLQDFTKNIFKLRDYSFSWLSGMYQWLQQSHSGSTYTHRHRILMRQEKGQVNLIDSSDRSADDLEDRISP